ncbi:MAG TPA: outer membrane protein assembly factor BamE [Verrucomicrobiae bacterium]|nr:outer membrane protein assembly factor BamE [Verrucomicrobiae bacterium]
MKLKPLPALLAATLLFTACVNVGRRLDLGRVDQIQKGMTREQVVRLVGEPSSTGGSGGEVVYTYIHVRVETSTKQHQMLRITFGPDGRVKGYLLTQSAD